MNISIKSGRSVAATSAVDMVQTKAAAPKASSHCPADASAAADLLRLPPRPRRVKHVDGVMGPRCRLKAEKSSDRPAAEVALKTDMVADKAKQVMQRARRERQASIEVARQLEKKNQLMLEELQEKSQHAEGTGLPPDNVSTVVHRYMEGNTEVIISSDEHGSQVAYRPLHAKERLLPSLAAPIALTRQTSQSSHSSQVLDVKVSAPPATVERRFYLTDARLRVFGALLRNAVAQEVDHEETLRVFREDITRAFSSKVADALSKNNDPVDEKTLNALENEVAWLDDFVLGADGVVAELRGTAGNTERGHELLDQIVEMTRMASSDMTAMLAAYRSGLDASNPPSPTHDGAAASPAPSLREKGEGKPKATRGKASSSEPADQPRQSRRIRPVDSTATDFQTSEEGVDGPNG